MELRLFLILLCSVSLYSCGSLSQTKETAITVNQLLNQYEFVETIVSSKYKRFDEKDQQLISELDVRIKNIIEDISNKDVSLLNYRNIYIDTMYSYSSVKRILINNRDLFESSEEYIIQRFDDNIVKLNDLINSQSADKKKVLLIIKEMVELSMIVMSSV